MRPWILLKENNIPFTEISLTLNTPEFHEKIGFYSDAGKVPVLVVGDVKIWDTYSIVEYLAETFPEKNLWPKNKVLRAVARSIVAEMHSGFTDLRRNLSMNLVEKLHGKTFSEEVWKDIRRIESIWKKCLSSYQGPFCSEKNLRLRMRFMRLSWEGLSLMESKPVRKRVNIFLRSAIFLLTRNGSTRL